MVVEKELIKSEWLYAREITRIFDRRISVLNPAHPVNLTRVVHRATTEKKIKLATERAYKIGKLNAEKDINAALKRASAAEEDTVVLGPFEDELVQEYTQETIEYMDYLAKDVQDKLNNTLQEGYLLGESIPKLTKRIEATWGLNKSRATMFARTQTNEVYNAAHLYTYQTDPAVEYIQFIAHLDSRTSPICRMYDKTIWKTTDAAIRRPPLHFNCRSRLVAYFGTFPGTRNYNKLSDGTKISTNQVNALNKQLATFHKKYWNTTGDKALRKAVKATLATEAAA